MLCIVNRDRSSGGSLRGALKRGRSSICQLVILASCLWTFSVVRTRNFSLEAEVGRRVTVFIPTLPLLPRSLLTAPRLFWLGSRLMTRSAFFKHHLSSFLTSSEKKRQLRKQQQQQKREFIGETKEVKSTYYEWCIRNEGGRSVFVSSDEVGIHVTSSIHSFG